MTASAPTPGIGKRIAVSEELAKAGDARIRVECPQDSVDAVLHFSSIGPKDEQMVRSQTGGQDIHRAISDPSSTTNILIIVWMARVKSGERSLTWQDIQRAYPDTAALAAAGLVFTYFDGDDEEAAEGAVDPTSSATGSAPGGPPSPSGTASTPGT